MMSQTIQPDSLVDAVEALIQQYGDETQIVLDECIEETAKEAKKQVKKFNSGRKKWEHYPKGWAVKIEHERLSTKATVHNKDYYRLTHLLEFGHATRNGGRTAAFPHIAEVNAFAQEDVLKRLREKLEG